MPMVVVITRDVEARYRGFLGSTMLELAPGMYAHPRMSAGVRTRIWSVLADWHGQRRRGSIVMTWADSTANGGLGLASLRAAQADRPPRRPAPGTPPTAGHRRLDRAPSPAV